MNGGSKRSLLKHGVSDGRSSILQPATVQPAPFVSRRSHRSSPQLKKNDFDCVIIKNAQS
jgi:hypothetical protein